MGKNQSNEKQNQKGYQREKDKFLQKSVSSNNKNDIWKAIHRILSPIPKTNFKLRLQQK